MKTNCSNKYRNSSINHIKAPEIIKAHCLGGAGTISLYAPLTAAGTSHGKHS